MSRGRAGAGSPGNPGKGQGRRGSKIVFLGDVLNGCSLVTSYIRRGKVEVVLKLYQMKWVQVFHLPRNLYVLGAWK